jgi:hypothetical protein
MSAAKKSKTTKAGTTGAAGVAQHDDLESDIMRLIAADDVIMVDGDESGAFLDLPEDLPDEVPEDTTLAADEDDQGVPAPAPIPASGSVVATVVAGAGAGATSSHSHSTASVVAASNSNSSSSSLPQAADDWLGETKDWDASVVKHIRLFYPDFAANDEVLVSKGRFKGLIGLLGVPMAKLKLCLKKKAHNQLFALSELEARQPRMCFAAVGC